ncbi:MAG: hypothetical protein ABR954_10495 [Dehalococcoidales bacterium]
MTVKVTTIKEHMFYCSPNPRLQRIWPSAWVFVGMLFGGGISIMNLIKHSRPNR